MRTMETEISAALWAIWDGPREGLTYPTKVYVYLATFTELHYLLCILFYNYFELITSFLQCCYGPNHYAAVYLSG